MNRLIEYRAWYKPEQRMYYNIGFSMIGVQVYKDTNVPEVVILDAGKDLFELMEFTGLCDCNNQKIFEGDVVEETIDTTTSGWDINIKGKHFKVVYQLGGFVCIAIDFDDTRFNLPLSAHYHYVNVVGNIFQDPDLLTNLDKNKDEQRRTT